MLVNPTTYNNSMTPFLWYHFKALAVHYTNDGARTTRYNGACCENILHILLYEVVITRKILSLLCWDEIKCPKQRGYHWTYPMLQAVSVIGAHHVIRVAILRTLRYSLGYSRKTWIFRISRRSADAISVIRAGHYAVGVIPNIHSCANSVINLAGELLRFPRAWRR